MHENLRLRRGVGNSFHEIDVKVFFVSNLHVSFNSERRDTKTNIY